MGAVKEWGQGLVNWRFYTEREAAQLAAAQEGDAFVPADRMWQGECSWCGAPFTPNHFRPGCCDYCGGPSWR